MTGTCKPGKQEHKSSDPLALEQFLSAFLLLMSGILLSALLLFLEYLYFKYIRKHLARSDQGGICALISLVSFKKLQIFFFLRGRGEGEGRDRGEGREMSLGPPTF